MTTHIHIRTFNGNIMVAPGNLRDELLDGADPDVLRDIGLPIADDAEVCDDSSTVGFDDNDEAVETLHEEHERLEATVDQVTSAADERVKPHTRAAHLYKAITTAGKLRKIRGGVTTHQQTSLYSVALAENAHERYNVSLSDTLKRACGACAFQGSCRLEGKTEEWMRVHPHNPKGLTKRQESMRDFRKRLDANPMANCVPPKPIKIARKQD
jgi:hypothetical protein